MIVCTEPLPNERVPISVARLWSCSAPATISEAEAEPPLISTTSGLPLVRSPPRAVKRWVSSGVTAAGRDHLAARHEGARHRDRLIKQAAGIVAEVDDIACELVLRDFLRDVGDRLVQAVGGLLVERVILI